MHLGTELLHSYPCQVLSRWLGLLSVPSWLLWPSLLINKAWWIAKKETNFCCNLSGWPPPPPIRKHPSQIFEVRQISSPHQWEGSHSLFFFQVLPAKWFCFIYLLGFVSVLAGETVASWSWNKVLSRFVPARVVPLVPAKGTRRLCSVGSGWVLRRVQVRSVPLCRGPWSFDLPIKVHVSIMCTRHCCI